MFSFSWCSAMFSFYSAFGLYDLHFILLSIIFIIETCAWVLTVGRFAFDCIVLFFMCVPKKTIHTHALNSACLLRKFDFIILLNVVNITMTSANGKIFRITGLCMGIQLPSQRPVTQSFDVFFGLRLNKQLRKQSSRR